MRSPRILTLIIPVTCSIFPVSWLSIAGKSRTGGLNSNALKLRDHILQWVYTSPHTPHFLATLSFHSNSPNPSPILSYYLHMLPLVTLLPFFFFSFLSGLSRYKLRPVVNQHYTDPACFLLIVRTNASHSNLSLCVCVCVPPIFFFFSSQSSPEEEKGTRR